METKRRAKEYRALEHLMSHDRHPDAGLDRPTVVGFDSGDAPMGYRGGMLIEYAIAGWRFSVEERSGSWNAITGFMAPGDGRWTIVEGSPLMDWNPKYPWPWFRYVPIISTDPHDRGIEIYDPITEETLGRV